MCRSAGSHLTTECNKPQLAQQKCYNCGKNHPANYQGCEVIKEFQKLTGNKNKQKQQMKTSKLEQFLTVNLKTHRTSRKPTVTWYLTILMKRNTLQVPKMCWHK
jgi:hypothetical protein